MVKALGFKHHQPATVEPMSSALNPLYYKDADTWLTLCSDAKFLTSWKKRTSLCCNAYVTTKGFSFYGAGLRTVQKVGESGRGCARTLQPIVVQ